MGITNSVTWVTEIFSPSLLNFIVYIPMYVSGIKHTESFFCSSISSSAFFIWYQSTDPGALKKSSSPFYHKQPSHVQRRKNVWKAIPHGSITSVLCPSFRSTRAHARSYKIEWVELSILEEINDTCPHCKEEAWLRRRHDSNAFISQEAPGIRSMESVQFHDSLMAYPFSRTRHCCRNGSCEDNQASFGGSLRSVFAKECGRHLSNSKINRNHHTRNNVDCVILHQNQSFVGWAWNASHTHDLQQWQRTSRGTRNWQIDAIFNGTQWFLQGNSIQHTHHESIT